MNVSDIELFKKSKIIEIGSVEKKLELRKVGGFSKKSGNPEIFVPKIWDYEPKTVPPIRKFSNSENLKKFCDKVVTQFLFYRYNFRYTKT